LVRQCQEAVRDQRPGPRTTRRWPLALVRKHLGAQRSSQERHNGVAKARGEAGVRAGR